MARLVQINREAWMTNRDEEMLVTIYHHNIINTRQMEVIHGKGLKNPNVIVSRRLKRWEDSGFILSSFFPYKESIRGMKHFTLTNKGAMIISIRLGIDPADIFLQNLNYSTLYHSVLINDFHIGLLNSGFEVPSYTVDRLNRVKFQYHGKDLALEPDAKGKIYSPISNRTYPFMMEMDRGTMGMEKFREKIKRYELFYKSGAYSSEFKRFPVIFIVTSTNNRLIKLKELVEEESKAGIQYLFTTINEMESLNEHVLHLVGHKEKVALK